MALVRDMSKGDVPQALPNILSSPRSSSSANTPVTHGVARRHRDGHPDAEPRATLAFTALLQDSPPEGVTRELLSNCLSGPALLHFFWKWEVCDSM